MSQRIRLAYQFMWSVPLMLAVVLAACSGADTSDPAITTQASSPPTSTSAAPATTTVPPGPGRLVITDDQGRVVVLDPDGSNARVLTEADGPAYFQPTWSPDGNLVAAGYGAEEENGLAVIDSSDGNVALSTSFTMPFYFYWSPDGSRVAYLNDGSDGRLELNLHVVGGNTTNRFGTGAPFYFSWAPDGGSIATHIGSDIMDIQSLGGDTMALTAPGLFQAPQWTDGGLFHIGLEGSTQRLLLTEEDTQSLGEVRGRVIFTATHDGSRVALASFSDQDGVSVAARPGRLTQIEPVLPSNRLIVLDVAAGEWETVTTEPVAAFFWSPDGSRLLTLGSGDGEFPVAWSVWDGELTGYRSFVPGPGFIQNVIPFFDQYAQSWTLWSPDGESFAYPAATNEGGPGIWVQDVDGGESTRVTGGSWVSWSSG